MQLHELHRKTPAKKSRRVGRGGKRGKTSGRGHKGQKARAGHRIRPEARDIIKKIPKRRGYGKHRAQSVNPSREVSSIVNLSQLEKLYTAGETVSRETLQEKGLVRSRSGKSVKILGTGTLTKKLTLVGLIYSQSVKEKVEKAGGKIQ